MREGNTIRKIRQAVQQGMLAEPLSPSAVATAIGIHFAGVFLPKLRVRNPGGDSELFVKVNEHPPLYRLLQH